MLGKVRHGWRRTKLRKIVLSTMLVLMVVVGGYKISMFVIARDIPSIDEFSSANK